jgi:hypothetical protein
MSDNNISLLNNQLCEDGRVELIEILESVINKIIKYVTNNSIALNIYIVKRQKMFSIGCAIGRFVKSVGTRRIQATKGITVFFIKQQLINFHIYNIHYTGKWRTLL